MDSLLTSENRKCVCTRVKTVGGEWDLGWGLPGVPQLAGSDVP